MTAVNIKIKVFLPPRESQPSSPVHVVGIDFFIIVGEDRGISDETHVRLWHGRGRGRVRVGIHGTIVVGVCVCKPGGGAQ